VRILLVEQPAETQRAKSVGIVEQHRYRAQLAAEPTGDTLIVALVEAGADLEHGADVLEGQRDHQRAHP
jgi:hypothetical protein